MDFNDAAILCATIADLPTPVNSTCPPQAALSAMIPIAASSSRDASAELCRSTSSDTAAASCDGAGWQRYRGRSALLSGRDWLPANISTARGAPRAAIGRYRGIQMSRVGGCRARCLRDLGSDLECAAAMYRTHARLYRKLQLLTYAPHL